MKMVLAFVAALACCEAVHAMAPQVVATPSTPAYGQAVTAEVRADWPVYLPAIRYAKVGNDITVDFEYVVDGFGPGRPDFTYSGLNLGELVPGNYTLRARLIDIANPSSPPTIVTSSLSVMPPLSWGLYLTPQAPLARQRFNVLINSAAYLYASSLKYTVSGSIVRIDFEYDANAPMWGAAPEGETTYAAIAIGGLAPGNYQIEAWGRAHGSADAQREFAIPVTVPSTSPVAEYYAESLDHYLITAGAEEIDNLDNNPSLGWKRTSLGFKAWLTSEFAPANAVPVCRFYASGSKSYIYTVGPECTFLRYLEKKHRAEAKATNKPFLGWGFQSIAFYALLPQNGSCPAGTNPVFRMANRDAGDSSSYRFTTDPMMRTAMTLTWNDEGIGFCVPR